ncbi:DUF2283 domain-containing protein [Rhodopila sp.]|uniref:DUF2283 domain-containing protein n=1 Tax=Rhodopila sp. TaxID=2480087 RepID=UPI003D144C05
MIKQPEDRVSYDPEADAIGSSFAPDGVEYDTSEEISPGLILDHDKQERIIGVELLPVKRLLAAAS